MKALLVLILFEISEASASHCTTPPSLITSLVSLECSILSDENNIQSLTEAFFPANHRRALTVQVHFYVNRSEHPLKLGAKNATSPDHVFLWFSSPVLSFIEPRMLQGFSLNTFIAEYHYAHLLIAPFFSTDEEWIRGLLGNATIWVCVKSCYIINSYVFYKIKCINVCGQDNEAKTVQTERCVPAI